MKLSIKCSRHPGVLFRNIFLVLCFLLICLIMYISFFMEQYVIKAQTRELDRSNLRILQQADSAVLRIAEDLERQARLSLADEAMAKHLLNPQDNNADNSIRLLHGLKNIQEICPEIERMWVYTTESEQVLSSDGFSTSLIDSGIAQLMESYRNNLPERSSSDLRETLMVHGSRLYLIIDFVPAKWLASFVFCLDSERLADILGSGQNGAKILMLDRHGRLLMAGNQPAKQDAAPVEPWDESHFYTSASSDRQDEQSYYQLQSNKLGLHFLMAIPAGRDLYDRSVLCRLILPALLMMSLLGAGGAYLITNRIYAPINRLMTLVMNRGEATPSIENEVDYLEMTYRQTLQDKDQLQNRFARLGGELRNYLCREVLAGRLDNHIDAENLLGLEPGSLYQAAVIKVGPGSAELQDPIQRKLQAAAAEHQIAQMPECLCCQEQAGGILAAVFRLPGNCSDGEQTELIKKIDTALRTLSAQTKGQFSWDMGTASSSFLHLQTSYESAVKSLQYRSYQSAEQHTGATVLDSTPEKELEQRLRQIVEQAVTGKEPAEQYCDRLIEEISKTETCLRIVETILLEKVQFCPESITRFPDFSKDAESTPAARKAFRKFCRDAIEQGRAYAGKKKFSYVEEAKKYMEEHYTDCSLSANEISEHIGISPSYFSSLFNEIQHQSISSYLNDIRISRAKNMLSLTQIPVKDIGFCCGFNSASVFGRVFKKYTGLSPKQFRDDSRIHKRGG